MEERGWWAGVVVWVWVYTAKCLLHYKVFVNSALDSRIRRADYSLYVVYTYIYIYIFHGEPGPGPRRDATTSAITRARSLMFASTPFLLA